MKNGTVENISGIPTKEQLEKINKFTRRPLKAEEVFVFTVTLCDNEVDRDFERFTKESLEKLKELFVGKTGIFDHSHKSKNQCARIFETEVLSEPQRQTRAGDTYYKLKAFAYMVRSEKNKNLILDIDAGIKKEVSVGCATSKRVCSVCGNDTNSCMHRKGRVYKQNGREQLCFFELSTPVDAYEWSFVAVPAQPGAGVTKSFKKERKIGMSIEELMKSFDEEEEIVLSKDQMIKLYNEFSALKSLGEIAKEYLGEQKKMIIKSFCEKLDDNSAKIFATVLDHMSAEELFKLFQNSKKQKDEILPQIKKQTRKSHNNVNRNFIV